MSKKITKRSLALGTLMAFVITGSAMAAEYTEAINVLPDAPTKSFTEDTTLINTSFINAGTVTAEGDLVLDNTSFTNKGTVDVTEKLTVDNATFDNIGTLSAKVLDVHTSSTPTFKGNITATEKFIYRGHNSLATLGDGLSLTTPKLEVIGDSNDCTQSWHSTRLIVGNDTVLNNVGDILIQSYDAQAALVIHYGAKVKYDKTITLESNTDTVGARIELFNNSSIELGKLIVDGSAGQIQYSLNDEDSPTVVGSSIIKNIEIKDKSKLVLCEWSEYDYTDNHIKFDLTNVTVGENGQFVSSLNQSNVDMTFTGNINMNLASNSKVDFGAFADAADLGNKMFVNFDAMNIYTEDATAEVYLSEGGKLKNENITVTSAAEVEQTKDVVWRTQEIEGQESTSQAELKVAEGVKLVQQTSAVDDVVTAEVAVDPTDATKSIVINKSGSKNLDTYGVAENNALSLISWRAEINDMNKRMGELRNSNGEHGFWLRMVRGEDEYESINHQYNQYQMGYDKKLSSDPSWTVGAAVSYTEGDSTYTTGSAENTHKGFSLYGSKLNDDGSFIDLIAKYARLENDFRNTWGTGDYSTNGYSLSAEYGKRYAQGNGVWIEPQVEVTYGNVSSVDYKIGNVNVRQAGIDSLVGRLGVSLGKDIKQGNVYARAAYLYDFDGETKATFADGANGNPRTLKNDLGGGWCEVGIGANINLSNATYLYADVEKTFGGEVDTNWQWNLGVRYSF